MSSDPVIDMALVDADTVRAVIAHDIDDPSGPALRRQLLRPLFTSNVRHLELESGPDLRVDRGGVRHLLAISEAYERAGGSVAIIDGTGALALSIQDALLARSPDAEEPPAPPAQATA